MPIVYFPGPVFKDFDAMIQTPRFLGHPFYPALCGLPFAGIDKNFDGYFGTSSVASDPKIDRRLALPVLPVTPDNGGDRETVFVLHTDQIFK